MGRGLGEDNTIGKKVGCYSPPPLPDIVIATYLEKLCKQTTLHMEAKEHGTIDPNEDP